MRNAFISNQLYLERLGKAAHQGFLSPVPKTRDEFCLTSLGRQAVERVIQAIYDKLGSIHPLPSTELDQLANLLHKVLLWRGEPRILDELYQKLVRRGYSLDEYAQSLGDLIERGWVEKVADEYNLTLTGLDVRQAAEEVTDHLFFKPWSCLSQEEMQELRRLLVNLGENLKKVN